MKRPIYYYAAALIGSVILGVLKPGFISSMLFYMLICLPIADLLTVAFTYNFFKVSHRIDKRVIAKGEKIQYRLEIDNPTLLLFAPIHIRYTGRGVLFHNDLMEKDDVIMLGPGERRINDFSIQCDYRGSYNVGVERVEIHGFFKLFRFAYNGIETLKVLVYPKIHELKAVEMRQALSDSEESIVSFDKFDQSLFSELRDYIPGDRLNRIHWKLSAGKDQWLTKEFEGNVNNKTIMLLNTEHAKFDFETNIIVEDYLIEGAVALSKYLLSNGTPTEFLWLDRQVNKVVGKYEKDFPMFYQQLAEVRFEQVTGRVIKFMHDHLKIDHGKCVLVFFSMEVSLEMAEFLMRQQRQGYEVHLVTAPLKGFYVGEKKLQIASANVYKLLDQGIQVFSLYFDGGTCRMEVA